jgi:hypothetical protein
MSDSKQARARQILQSRLENGEFLGLQALEQGNGKIKREQQLRVRERDKRVQGVIDYVNKDIKKEKIKDLKLPEYGAIPYSGIPFAGNFQYAVSNQTNLPPYATQLISHPLFQHGSFQQQPSQYNKTPYKTKKKKKTTKKNGKKKVKGKKKTKKKRKSVKSKVRDKAKRRPQTNIKSKVRKYIKRNLNKRT